MEKTLSGLKEMSANQGVLHSAISEEMNGGMGGEGVLEDSLTAESTAAVAFATAVPGLQMGAASTMPMPGTHMGTTETVGEGSYTVVTVGNEGEGKL